ncbi:tripartite tricarboxylate transporter TctB family protein [Phytomonospora sp. NPDC050363]|uniref:tripartite tricarboxylate transporter TctB family protein n=1 Tax=Phytomonospora sp. NPDC050363 TaxID=3155642 RepID=UPI0033C4CCB0
MSETTPEPGPGASEVDAPGPGPKPARTPVGPRIVGGVLLLTGLYLLWEAYRAIGDDELTIISPRLAPLIVTGMWVLFSAIYFVRQLVSPTADYPVPGPPDGHVDTEDEHTASDTVHDPIDWRTPTLVAVLLVAYVLLLEHAGFVLSTAAFYLGASRVLGSRKWIRDIIVAVVLALGVYLAFTRLLDIFLPEGVLPL